MSYRFFFNPLKMIILLNRTYLKIKTKICNGLNIYNLYYIYALHAWTIEIVMNFYFKYRQIIHYHGTIVIQSKLYCCPTKYFSITPNWSQKEFYIYTQDTVTASYIKVCTYLAIYTIILMHNLLSITIIHKVFILPS